MSRDPQKVLLVLAALGLVGCLAGLWLDARTMLATYLAVWFAVVAIPIGAIGVLFTSYLVRGGWTRDLHEILSDAALTIPVSALLFVPIVAGLGEIFPWTSDAVALPAFKAAYLTPLFFVLRAVIYFAIFSALAAWAALAYGDDAAMIRSASAGLIIWALVTSLAGIDWAESVEPHFHSSIYGLLTIGFVLLGGLAFALVALLSLKGSHQMSNAAYSGVLLSTLLLWAYLHAMQYIIIWTGNIPDEVTWYTTRLEGGWGFVLWSLFIGQFFLPFFAMLSERVRSSTAALIWIAGGTLLFRLVEAIVLILPPLGVSGLASMLDVPAAVLLIGGGTLLAWRAATPLRQRWSGRAAAAH